MDDSHTFVQVLVQAFCYFFFFNDTPTPEIYTLSLHDALPISSAQAKRQRRARSSGPRDPLWWRLPQPIRRSEEHTSELQSHSDLVCRLLLEKKKRQSSKSRHAIMYKSRRSKADNVSTARTRRT